MRAVVNWQRRRNERRLRLIAAARRRQMEQLLETGPHNAADPSRPMSEQRQTFSVVGVGWALLTALTLVAGFGAGGPFFASEWDPVILLVSGSVSIISGAESWRHLRRSGPPARIVSALGVLVIASSFALGLNGQVSVQDRPQWRYSDAAKASELAFAIRADLYILQENQSLFSYPPEQARSMLAYYESASVQADRIAARWNPAIAPAELPLPGFISVLEKVNTAADQQRQALAAFADYVRQPDARLAEQIQVYATNAETNYLLAAQELASTVTPLGLELAPDGD
jgi:hypothetical protein